ncbi:hypothetical protein H4R27_002123 [Coemansia aciculifera]|uniref:Uncharacterized protein n=1 Tax=Coemansia pectinata TaxID=1052879 RepID=A0A9W8H2F5_9FUNG|nr:hypothetical protein GGI19_002596 [Coemansia pectinata]KAJ2875739.1 hypothetical protein GGH93_001337 [Coemansia aciculifera]KAJ2884409.1 hypothetical protein H4R27_002123 [Coemansia aciculifera]
MWTSSRQAISPPSPTTIRTATYGASTAAADDDNCQNDACCRDSSHSDICRDDNGSSTSLASTLWDASQAQEARDVVSSMEARYAHLSTLMRALNYYGQNPLGGAMCADYENRIHQTALLINGQITKLRRMVGECELRLTRSISSQSRSSSLADWEEVRAMSNDYNNDDPPMSASNSDLPPANTLKEIRLRLLTGVSQFFNIELPHVKASLAPFAVQPST